MMKKIVTKMTMRIFQRTGLLKMLDVECSVRGCPETYVQKVKVQHKENTRSNNDVVFRRSLYFYSILQHISLTILVKGIRLFKHRKHSTY
jgi:hypothetical protein